jgi:hypothetical protein
MGWVLFKKGAREWKWSEKLQGPLASWMAYLETEGWGIVGDGCICEDERGDDEVVVVP